MTSRSPAAWAASTFCLTPPIGRTRPCSVTSPVMPTVWRTGRPVSSDVSAVVIGVPAHVGERDARGLLHHVAELAGEHQVLLALHARRLDEEDVAADAGHRQ